LTARSRVLVAVLFALAAVACGASRTATADSSTSVATAPVAPVVTAAPGTDLPTSTPTTAVVSTRDRLAVLVVDDRPSPNGPYRREEWPHWSDIDGNGCDARQDALVAWSLVPATVDRSHTCRVVAGSWVSPYDLKASNNPGDFDVDHLVPLENAFVSGGWQWDAPRRRAFANTQSELVVASASANRSKGADAPDRWRPPDRDAWCAYADGWVSVKGAWGLTVTTIERDALGQMLDTCGILGPYWPRGG
jgi:hypothetical protein